MIRIIIAGCRSWDFKQAGSVVDRMIAKYGQDGFMLVHHGHTGVAAAFEKAATERGILTDKSVKECITDREASLCLAIHRNLAKSRDTRVVVESCFEAEIPVYLIDKATTDMKRITSVE